MKLGIIGRPGSGKTSLFRALGGSRDKIPHPPGTESAIVSVDVPDPRMEWLRELEKPKKYTPARVEFVDFASIPVKSERGKSELLSSIREVDGLVIVVRAFSDPSYPYDDAQPHPIEEASSLKEELLLSDYTILQSRMEKLQVSVKKPTKNREQEMKELSLLERIIQQVENEGKHLRDIEMNEEETALLRSFRFLSEKPALWVINHEEGKKPESEIKQLQEQFQHIDSLCAILEEEIAGLDEEDRATFMEEYGIQEPARAKLIRDAYMVLGQQSFFTTGPDEVRAWTIRKGDNAVTSAGKIHSDLARGFIRAEVTPWETLKELGSWQVVKAQKKIRLEGKEYIVQDGDIVHIRFNV